MIACFNGITWRAIIEICQKRCIAVEQRSILKTDIEKSTEAMVVDTAFEITPVVKINGIKVDSGSPGPFT